MGQVTVLDGGMGKELRRIGAPFRQPEWSALALIEAPERVLEAHRNFIEAGAEVIITNNYAVVPYHLGDRMFAERGAELTALAGRLAREAADSANHPIVVAGSLPPLFGSYQPERFDAAQAARLYRAMVAALDPFVDLWIGETFSRIDELDAIVEAVGAAGSGQPVWVGFALPDEWADGHGVAVRSGETPDDIAAAVSRHDGAIAAVVFNCSMPEQTGPAIRALGAGLARYGVEARIGGYANAFPSQSRTGDYAPNAVVLERRDEMTARQYADIVAGWIEDGATIVGGCCDMYPEHIAELAARFGRPTHGENA